ncbi:MAG TPA: hypothetical protein VGK19_18750 [Capsulimonadaceae bacterium]|jgi:hypothetical protein
MSITIVVPDDITEQVEQAARMSGSSAEQLLLETIRDRFSPTTRKHVQLRKGKYSVGQESREIDFELAEWHDDEVAGA